MTTTLTHHHLFEDLAPSSGFAPEVPGLTAPQIAELLHTLDEARMRVVRVLASSKPLGVDVAEGADAERRALARLEAIQVAYRRISAGTYNICVDCGGAVGAERLAAIPETNVCLACALANRPESKTASPT